MGAAAEIGAPVFGPRTRVQCAPGNRRLLRIGFHIGAAWLRALPGSRWMNHNRRLRSIRRWASGIARSLEVEVLVKGAPIPRGVPLMFVANHISWLDVCVLCNVESSLFVAKAELAGWPMLGRIAQAFGTFFHRRGRLRDAARVKDRIAAALRANWPVAVFPEGTTGDGRALMPFYPAMIQAAVDAHAMVQPVAIRYLDRAGAPNMAVPFVGDQTFADSLRQVAREPVIVAELTFGAAFSAKDRSRREVTAMCHRFIASALEVPECQLVADPRYLRSRSADLRAHPRRQRNRTGYGAEPSAA
jgi:1-acyl-sn-glycerol-3-phosphate acyltransferase